MATLTNPIAAINDRLSPQRNNNQSSFVWAYDKTSWKNIIIASTYVYEASEIMWDECVRIRWII